MDGDRSGNEKVRRQRTKILTKYDKIKTVGLLCGLFLLFEKNFCAFCKAQQIIMIKFSDYA